MEGPTKIPEKIDTPRKPKNERAALEEVFEKCEKVVAFLKTKNDFIEPTALPAISLCLYELLSKNSRADRIAMQQEFEKINTLSEIEAKYKNPGNPLPTIGIEVEFPDVVDSWKIGILEKLNIPYRRFKVDFRSESPRSGPHLEVNPSFSYSPYVQNRILQELVTLQIIPQNVIGEWWEINDLATPDLAYPYSLHINCGTIGKFYDKLDRKVPEGHKKVNMLLTFAFTSAERLESRKTRSAIQIKSDSVLKSTKNEKSDSGLRYRSESRALEFSDKSSFRLLIEAQPLFALANILAKMRGRRGIALTPVELRLVSIAEEFELKIEKLFKKNEITLDLLDSPDSFLQQKAQSLAEDPTLTTECRNLVHTYATKTLEITKAFDDLDDAEKMVQGTTGPRGLRGRLLGKRWR